MATLPFQTLRAKKPKDHKEQKQQKDQEQGEDGSSGSPSSTSSSSCKCNKHYDVRVVRGEHEATVGVMGRKQGAAANSIAPATRSRLCKERLFGRWQGLLRKVTVNADGDGDEGPKAMGSEEQPGKARSTPGAEAAATAAAAAAATAAAAAAPEASSSPAAMSASTSSSSRSNNKEASYGECKAECGKRYCCGLGGGGLVERYGAFFADWTPRAPDHYDVFY